MKTTSLVCSALVASLGFASIAQAQDWRGGRRYGGHEAQQQWRGQRSAAPQRWQQQRHEAHDYHRGWRHDDRYGRAYAPRNYAYGGYYGAPHYRSYYAPGYYVGGYAPDFVARRYWINDWRARNLYAPPYGYEWVQTDSGDVLLIALATGLIANAILAAH